MLTLNDGRTELWQWDTGRTLAVDADCSQVHFSNKVFGRSIDVDVADGVAIIPDVLLQAENDLNVWAFVGTAENGYTKISKTFKVNRRNKPADYVFTPPDQTTLAELVERLGKLEESQDPEAIKNAVEDYLAQNPVEVPVQSVNGKTGTVELNAEDVGAISQYKLQEATNEALAQAKASGAFDGPAGPQGEPGPQGPAGPDGAPGKDGTNGADGITPSIGNNGNWYLGATDTGKPSRGEKGDKGDTGATGATGATGSQGPQGPAGPKGEKGDKGDTGATGSAGADGKSAYAYAVEGGYTGTEAEFAEKLASGVLIVTITESNGTLSADKTFTEIRDAIIAGTTVLVDYGGISLPLILLSADALWFGTIQCANADDSNYAAVGTVIIEITENNEVNDISVQIDIPKTLPNPNAITFTGAVTGSYDGSAPLNVNIPRAVTDDHINELINTALNTIGVAEEGAY